jgi:hypothetical protein
MTTKESWGYGRQQTNGIALTLALSHRNGRGNLCISTLARVAGEGKGEGSVSAYLSER